MRADRNERLHERLAALRRVTVKRGATKAEAATAKRLADQLATRLGKQPTRVFPLLVESAGIPKSVGI